MAKAIANAIENLELIDSEEFADYSAVDEALSNVPEDLSIYTEETVQALEEAIAAVERDLPANDQERVDAMAKAIADAIENLELIDPEEKPEDPGQSENKVNRSDLEEAIKNAEKKNKNNYTLKSWNAFEKALLEAKKVVKDELATQEAINLALSNLMQESDNLVLVTSEEQGLPKTASNMFNLLASGLLLFLLGSSVFFIRKRGINQKGDF